MSLLILHQVILIFQLFINYTKLNILLLFNQIITYLIFFILIYLLV